MKLFLSPHNDDAALFGAFTIIRESPLVLTCLDSYIQPSRGHDFADAGRRRAEDIEAMHCLGAKVQFAGIPDSASEQTIWSDLSMQLRLFKDVTRIWAPAQEISANWQHNLIGTIADEVFGRENVEHYLTYTTSWKSVSDYRVRVDDGAWVAQKLRALACYTSQHRIDNCRPHFLRDLEEYYV